MPQSFANSKKHTCYIIAGPNGAGKTSFATGFLPAIVHCSNFLNVDEIARGLSPLAPTSNTIQIRAGRLFWELLEESFQGNEDFAFETTLSGRIYLTRIPAWQRLNWKFVLFYLFIPSPMLCLARVKERVLKGGHDVPEQDIRRRYQNSLHNLFKYTEVCDQTFCFDNSQKQRKSIFEKSQGQDFFVYDQEIFSQLKQFS